MTDEQLDSLLKGLDDNIQVPQEVSNKWKCAVRKEMRARKLNRFWAYVGSAAAVIVLIIGALLIPKQAANDDNPGFIMLETDGSDAEVMFAKCGEADTFDYVMQTYALTIIEETDEYTIIEAKTQDVQTVLNELSEYETSILSETNEYTRIKIGGGQL